MIEMTPQERLLRKLCIEIALNQIGGKKFNTLLIESGIYLDDQEWDLANKLLGQSTQLMNWVEHPLPTC
ncbi:MAG: hypothetical protein HYT76_05530 [Deltaproteobacteria bacterium]|nr:hypothetical protein [Deltaproteobacteria bacterium]